MDSKKQKRLINMEIGKIFDKHCNGCIAKDYCDFCHINTQIRAWGKRLEIISGENTIVEETKKGRKVKPLNSLNIDLKLVDKRHKNGEKLTEIAKEMEIIYDTLKKYLYKYRKENKITSTKKTYNDWDFEKIVERKRNGEHFKKIAAEIGCHYQTLVNKVNQYKKENGLDKSKFPIEEVYKRIRILRQPAKKVAPEYGITDRTLRDRLRKYEENLKKQCDHATI